MFILFNVENALNFADRPTYLAKFWERWKKLKEWDCSPVEIRDYFSQTVKASAEIETSGKVQHKQFETGNVTTSYKSRGWSSIDPVLPAFSYITSFERTGTPIKLRMIDTSGKELIRASACIDQYIDAWSHAILLRGRKIDELKSNNVLSRTQVASMNNRETSKVYEWSFNIIKSEFKIISNTGSKIAGDFELLKGAIIICSKMSMKLNDEQLQQSFEMAIALNELPIIKDCRSYHDLCNQWFSRIFSVANSTLSARWFPKLLGLPIPTKVIEQNWRIRDLTSYFSNVDFQNLKSDCETQAAIEWLFSLNPKVSNAHDLIIFDRLLEAYWLDAMNDEHEIKLGSLLWSENLDQGIPSLHSYLKSNLLNLPHPESVDVKSRFKGYILSGDFETAVTRASDGKISIGSSTTLKIREILASSIRIVEFYGSRGMPISWSKEEKKLIIKKLQAWWDNEKVALPTLNEPNFSMMFRDSITETVEYIPQLVECFFSQNPSEKSDIIEPLTSIIDDIEKYGIDTTRAVPYLLLRGKYDNAKSHSILLAGITSDQIESVSNSSCAIRHWFALSNVNLVLDPEPEILQKLMEKLIYRSGVGLSKVMKEVALLIIEFPHAFTDTQLDYITGSLSTWEEITRLDQPAFSSLDPINDSNEILRVRIAMLAAAISIGYTQLTKANTEKMTSLINRLKQDPLPEVRESINSWLTFEPKKVIRNDI